MKTMKFNDIPNHSVEAVILHIGTLVPKGTVSFLSIEHDPGCPCEKGNKPQPCCDCKFVNISVKEITSNSS